MQDQNSPIPPRSQFITTLAWIFIVLGGVSTLYALFQNVMLHLFVLPAFPECSEIPTSPVNKFLFSHIRLFGFLFFIICALTFTSALGLLNRQRWSYGAFIGIMIFGIALCLGNLVLCYFIQVKISTMMNEVSPETLANTSFLAKYIILFTAIPYLLFAGLSAWIIKRLRAPEIQAEFASSES